MGLSWTFYSMLAISISGICVVSTRAALYKIKVIHEQQITTTDCTSRMEDITEWNNFQSRFHSEYQFPSKINRDSQITFTASDEDDFGIQLPTTGGEAHSLSPTTIYSNQSTIDTNDCFRDDEVNSFNDELEPLTPSPRASSLSSTAISSTFFP
jgi:hypothetical protein